MKPADGGRVWRKTRRAAQRGIPAGRRATHRVEMAYGQQQKIRDNNAAWAAALSQWRAATEVTS
jgi:hypothetical protein